MVPNSYAGASRGTEDPEDVISVDVNEDTECPEDRCGKTGTHLVIIWTGNEYSRRNTWISASTDSTTMLEDME